MRPCPRTYRHLVVGVEQHDGASQRATSIPKEKYRGHVYSGLQLADAVSDIDLPCGQYIRLLLLIRITCLREAPHGGSAF